MGNKWRMVSEVTPLKISGSQLWLDPTDNSTVNGGGVPPETLASWVSKTSSGSTFSPSGSMDWGTVTKNHNPVIDGGTNVLSGSIENGPFSTWTLFVVFNIRDLVDKMVLLGSAEADPVIRFIDDSGKFALRVELDLVPQLTSNSFFDSDRWYQVCISFDGSTCFLYIDGVGDNGDSVSNLALPNELVILGDANFNWPTLHAWLGDVILYEHALSAAQVALISNYLQRKWAL